MWKYYKDIDNKIYAYEADGSQDDWISSDLISISEKEAESILKFETEKTIRVESVTLRQAKLALLHVGVYSEIDQEIKSLPGDEGIAARIEWEYASSVERDSPLVTTLTHKRGMTEDQLNDLFTLASTL